MSTKVRCPRPTCGLVLALPAEAPPGQLRCPKCGQVFALAPATAATRIMPAAAPPPGPAASPPPATAITTPVPAALPVGPAGPLPQRVGRFVVQGFLGEGAFGRVYKAHDPQLDRPVALKVAKPEFSASEQRSKRFLGEARAAANLRHPNIVPVFDSGTDGPHLFIASAFIAGRSLDRALADGPLPPRQAAEIVRKVADALAYAHAQGVVHRDVKPANVLLDERGEPLLADFGLAVRAEGGERLTQEGAGGPGTPAYMAPEHGRGQAEPASDQYSLGCTLFELLTGRTPFDGPPELQLFLHASQPPPSPRRHNRALPRDLETVTLKCLEKEPGKRYGSCQELSDDLRRWLDGLPIRARRLGLPERVARWAKREPRLAAASGAALLFLVAGLSAYVYRTAERDKENQEKITAQEDKNQALEATNKAQAGELQANAARDLAQASEKRRYDAALYAIELRRAVSSLDRRRPAEASAVLESTAAAMRGWEWSHLLRRCREEGGTTPLTDGKLESVAVGPDGQWLVCGGDGLRVLNLLRKSEVVRLEGHQGAVHTVAVSPDGRRIASGGEDRTVRLWDVPGGREVLALRNFAGPVRALAFAPGGKHLVSADGGGAVVVWDAASGREVRKLRGRTGSPALAVSVRPDGGRVAAVGQEGVVQLWDAQTGAELRKLEGATGELHAVAFSPDGRHVAAGGVKGRGPPHMGRPDLLLWDADRGGPPRAFAFAPSPAPAFVSSLAFTPDGKSLVCNLALFDVASGRAEWEAPGGAVGVAVGPEGRRVFLAGENLRLWQPGQNAALTLPADERMPPALHFSADGQSCVAFGDPVRVWNVRGGEERRSFPLAPGRPVLAAAFSPDGRRLAVSLGRGPGGQRGDVRTWDVERGQPLASLAGLDQWANSLAYSPDGRRLAVGLGGSVKNPLQDVRGRLLVLDVESGKEVLALDGHSRLTRSVAWSPDGRWLASSGGEGDVKVWDVATGKELFSRNYPYNLRPIDADHGVGIAFSPDGRRLVCGTAAGIARVLEVPTGQELLQLRAYAGWVSAVAYAAGGQRILTGDAAGNVKVWDGASGQELLALSGPGPAVTQVAMSPGGASVAARAGGALRVWGSGPAAAEEGAAGRERLVLPGHAGPLRAVGLTADGTRVVSFDGEALRLWDRAGGRVRQTTPAASGLVKPGAGRGLLSPDGRRLLTTGVFAREPGQALVWGAGGGEPRLCIPAHAARLFATFSPDGKYVATCGERINKGVEACVWEYPSGKLVFRRVVGAAHHSSVAFSPDGRRLAVGGWTLESGTNSSWGLVEVLDTRSGNSVFRVRGTIHDVNAVAFTPDGRRVVTGGGMSIETPRVVGLRPARKTSQLRVWDAQTGAQLLAAEGHRAAICAVAVSPDGRHIATGSEDNQLKVWDAATLKELRVLPGNGGSVWSVAWSPDGRRLAAVLARPRGPSELKVWEAASGREVLAAPQADAVQSVAYRPDGKALAILTWTGALVLLDAATGRELSRRATRQGAPTNVAFSPAGDLLLTTGLAPSAFHFALRAVDGGKPLAEGGEGWSHLGPEAFSADGRSLALAGQRDGRWQVQVLDAVTGQHRKTLPVEDTVHRIALSPDGARLVTAPPPVVPRAQARPAVVSVWDTASGQKVFELAGHTAGVNQLAFSPDGKRVAVGTVGGPNKPGELLLWGAADGRRLATLDADRGGVLKLGRGGEVTDVRTGKPFYTSSPQGEVTQVLFSPDGGRLASIHSWPVNRLPEELCVWEVATGKPLFSRPVPRYSLLAFSPDGKRLAVATGATPNMHPFHPYNRPGAGHALHVLDTTSGRVQLGVRLTAPLTCLAMAADGQYLVGGAFDGSARLWDVTGEDADAPLDLLSPGSAAPGARALGDLARIDVAWHRLRADQARLAGDRHAEAFHLDCALAGSSGGPPDLLARRDRLLAEAVRDDPTAAWAVRKRSRAVVRGAGPAEEAAALLAALPQQPEDARTLCLLGGLRLRAGRTKEAVAALEQAQKLRGTAASPVVELLLALAHHRLKDPAEARRHLDAAARAGPEERPAGRDWETALELRLLRAEAEKSLAGSP